MDEKVQIGVEQEKPRIQEQPIRMHLCLGNCGLEISYHIRFCTKCRSKINATGSSRYVSSLESGMVKKQTRRVLKGNGD